MSRIFSIFLVFFAINLYAGNVTVETDKGKVILNFNFGSKTEIIEKKMENNKLSFSIKGEHDIETNIWSQYVNKIVHSKNNGFTNIDVVFENKPEKFDLQPTDNGVIVISTFPEKLSSVPSEGSTFAKMILSVIFILILILIFYWLIKVFIKKTYVSNIPGIGRSIGKVDLMPGKSIVFYEIKNVIYMFGLAGDNINLLDKIEDLDLIDAIKAGFSKKEDFSSYFRFFTNKDIKEEIEVSSTIIKDKVESLKKRS
jgi:flagellar biogenesis protein FliO